MSKFLRYVPFTKVDEDERMVFGLATDETPDAQGDVVDYEATKRAVGDWSQWRNVREMHQPQAAGVAETITLDDAAKSLDIGVHVVDDQAWEKVKAGVYKGFSIGGKVLDAVTQTAAEGEEAVRRITRYALNEISLVDRPANPSATFSLVKRDLAAAHEAGAEEGDEAEALRKLVGEEMAKGLPDLAKAITEATEGLAKVADMEQVAGDLQALVEATEGLAKVADVAGVADDLQKVVGDLAQVVQAFEALDERLETVEKAPAGTGPVLREIGALGPVGLDGQSEGVLKSLMAQATDPGTREWIGQRLAEMQIKLAQQRGQVIAMPGVPAE